MHTAAYEYRTKLSKILIDRFQEEFIEKVGVKPSIYVPMLRHGSRTRALALRDLRDEIDTFIEQDGRNPKTIASKFRYKNLLELRMIFCFIARRMGYSLKAIGAQLDGRDHTTILHTLTSFENLIHTDDRFRDLCDIVLTHLQLENIDGTTFICPPQQKGHNAKSVLGTMALPEQSSVHIKYHRTGPANFETFEAGRCLQQAL